MVPLVDDGAGLETLVCPTVTQTVYLRPKTVTKTIHVIRPTGAAGQAQQAAQSLDYVTVASPNAGQPDLGRTVAPGVDSAASPAGAPAAGAQACGNSRQSTEFRNFVYISVRNGAIIEPQLKGFESRKIITIKYTIVSNFGWTLVQVF